MTLPRRWLLGRCGVRLSLRGAGGGLPRTGWFAAAPAVRRPTDHRIVARRYQRADRCCDGERWAAVAASSPALCPALTVVTAVAEPAAVTLPAAAARIRRCRSRSVPRNDGLVRDGPARSSRPRVRRSGLRPTRRRRWNGVPAAQPTARIRRCSVSGATACHAKARCRMPKTPSRRRRPDRYSNGCQVLRRATNAPRS